MNPSEQRTDSRAQSHVTDTRFPLQSTSRHDADGGGGGGADDAVSDISDVNEGGNAHDQGLDDMSSVSSFDVDSPRSPRGNRPFRR